MRKLLVSFFCVGRLAALCAAVGMPTIDPRVPPIFTGSVMTNETVLFMGTDDAAPLMYKADRILSVTSFDLKTNYVEGVDWTFDAATHTIRPTPNTRMPYYKESEWYPAKGRFRCNRPGKPFVFFSEGSVISLHQVCVTYSHSDAWDGPVPRGDAAAFALDFAGREIGPASATVADGWYSITPVPGAFSYRIIAPHSNAL